MKSNRKTMLAAALVVAVVALAGAGYAAAIGYKATTVIEDNTVDGSKYITIKANDDAYTTGANLKYAFDTETYWNTDVTPAALYLNYGTAYDISTGTSVSHVYESNLVVDGSNVTVNPYNENTKADGTYKAVAATTITVTIDTTNSANSTVQLKNTLSALPNNTNGSIKVFIVKTVDTSSTLVSELEDVTENLSGATIQVTYTVYLAVPTLGVALASAATNASWTGTMSFEAKVTA